MSPDRLAAAFERAAVQMSSITDDLAELLQRQDVLRAAHEASERSKRRLTGITLAVLVAVSVGFGARTWASQQQFDRLTEDRENVAHRQTCELELIGRWAAALGRRDAVPRDAPSADTLRLEALARANDMERVRELCP